MTRTTFEMVFLLRISTYYQMRSFRELFTNATVVKVGRYREIQFRLSLICRR